MPIDVATRKKLPWGKIVGLGVLLLLGVAVLLSGVDIRGAIDKGLALIQAAGPVAFFLGFALLPCAAVPISAFSLTAGPAFGDKLGFGVVLALSLLAVAVNVAVSYFLARRALRPLLERLVARFGYRIPQVAADDATGLIVLCRVTPGIPFFAQNYLLGLANAPFGKYFVLSCAISGPTTAAFVIFGDALLEGRGRVAFISLSLLVALAVATHLLRRHYARKQAST